MIVWRGVITMSDGRRIDAEYSVNGDKIADWFIRSGAIGNTIALNTAKTKPVTVKRIKGGITISLKPHQD